MTDIKKRVDTKRLRVLAEKSTPGPWNCAGGIYVYSGDTMVADNNDETALIRARGVGGGMSREQQEANVEFVAAANPQTVLKLIAIIEKLREQRDDILMSYNRRFDMSAEISDLDKELDEIVGQG